MSEILHPIKTWIILLTALAAIATASVDEKLNSLTDSLLASPAGFDLTVAYKIKEMRTIQQQEKEQALDQLILGLHAYLNSHFTDAAEFLHNASASQYTIQLTQAALAIPLETLIDDCKAAAKNTSCEDCLGSTNNDCDQCDGSTMKLCRTCKGFGKVKPESENRKKKKKSEDRARTVICIECSGLGAVRCENCGNTGIVPCKCITRFDVISPAPSSFIDRARFNNLISIARYLRNGGIDFFTPQAIKLAPKLSHPKN